MPSTVKTVSPAYTPVVTGTPRTTGIISGPAGTPRIIETPTATGGIGGTRPTLSTTGPQATAGGSGAGVSPAGDSPVLAATIAGTFNHSRLHQASLQDVYLTSVGTSRSSGSGAGAASAGGERFDADVTAVRKGDLMNNCPDDTISIKLRGMDPASPVAGQIVTGGSQLVFGDSSIRTVEIGNGEMKIASLRHAKLFGILNLQYTEVSTISPSGPVKIDKPFWVGLPGTQLQASVSGNDPCAGQAMGRQGSGMTPGVTPTMAPDYQVNEVEITCPCDKLCQPEAYQRCYDTCLSQFPGEYNWFQYGEYCNKLCYRFDLNCCFDSCMHSGTDPAQLADDQFALKSQGCRAECDYKLALSILQDVAERQSQTVGQIMRA
jgi:hypothetical protein